MNLYFLEAAALSITKEQTVDEGSFIVFSIFFNKLRMFIYYILFYPVHDGDKMYSICSYIAETDEAINLVEGEKVFVIGWFSYLQSIKTC